MSRIQPSFLLLCAAAAVIGCGDSPRASTPKLSGPSIAIAVPRSGPLAELGRDTEKAARMEFETRSKEAALKELKLVVIDESGTAGESSDAGHVAQETQKLVDSGVVVGLVGGIDSDALAVELPRLNEAGIAAVSPAATATSFNRRDPAFPGAPIKYYPAFGRFGLSFARTAPTDLGLIKPCLGDIADRGVKRVFTVDSGDTDGDSFSSAVESEAVSEGLTLSGHESVPRGTADWEGLVRQIAASQAEAVIWGSAAGTGEKELWREIRRAGLGTQMMLGSAVPPGVMKSLAAVKGGTSICTAAVPGTVQTPTSSDLAEKFRSRWGHEPAPGSLRGAAAMALLLTAIERGGKLDSSGPGLDASRQAITGALARTRSFDSLLGRLQLDNLGNWAEAPVGLWSLRGGRLSFRALR